MTVLSGIFSNKRHGPECSQYFPHIRHFDVHRVGSNDHRVLQWPANESAAFSALCSAVLLFTAILSTIEWDAVGARLILSSAFGGAAAWFWLVSAQALDLTEIQVSGSLFAVIALAAVFGAVEPVVHIVMLLL